MLRMSRFITGIFLGLPSFSPIQNSQNTCKNAQNVEIYQNFQKMLGMLRFITGIFLGLRSFSPIQNGQNTCKNSQTKNFPKMLRMLRFIMGIFLGLRSFSPIQNGQNTSKHSQKKIFSKMLRMSRFIMGIFFLVTIIFTYTPQLLITHGYVLCSVVLETLKGCNFLESEVRGLKFFSNKDPTFYK